MKALVRIGLFALQALSMLLLLWGVLWGLMTLFGVILLIGWGSRGFIIVMMTLSAALTPLCAVMSSALLSKWTDERKRGLPFLPEERSELLRACAAAAVALMAPLAWLAPSTRWMTFFLFVLDLIGLFLGLTFFSISFRRRKRGDSYDPN